MAMLLRPGETATFDPADGSGITYRFRVPLIYDQMVYKRRLVALGARQHDEGTVLRLLRRGVAEIMADSPADRRESVLAAVDAQIARREAHVALARETDIRDVASRGAFLDSMRDLLDAGTALADVVDLVTAEFPAFATVLADNAVFGDLAGIAAAEAGLIGWDGIDPPLERPSMERGGDLRQDALSRIPARHLAAFAPFWEGLLAPSEAQAKNSDSPSSGPSDPGDFDGGEDATPDAPLDGDAWEIPELGLRLTVHPVHLLDDETTTMLRLWSAWRRGEAGHLPFAGGMAEQPACTMAALAIMDAAARLLRPKGKEGDR